MRILMKKDGRRESLLEVKEVQVSGGADAIAIPELKKKFLTGDHTRTIFQALCRDGFADLTGYESERHVEEVLL